MTSFMHTLEMETMTSFMRTLEMETMTSFMRTLEKFSRPEDGRVAQPKRVVCNYVT